MKRKALNRDLVALISHSWGRIEHRYKVAFFVALSINVVVYLVFIVHQPMHSHGILSRLLYLSPYDQLAAGRWFSVVIFNVFSNSNLMIMSPLVTILLHICGGIMTVYLWDKNSSALSLTVGALLVSLYPAVMTSFYFSFLGPVFSGPHVLAPLALLVVSSQSIGRVVSGALIICVMMATYQPGLSILLAIFMALLIVRFFEFGESPKKLRKLLSKEIYPRVYAILLGGLLYKISISLLGVAASPATKAIGISEVLTKFALTLQKSFSLLVTTQPEFLMTVKMTLLAVVILAFLTLCVLSYKRISSPRLAIWRVLLLAVLFVGLILATKGMYLVSSNENFWTYRYNHATGYLYMFGFFVLLRYLGAGYLKNITYLVLCFVLIKFAYADILRQRVLLSSQEHHLAIANRILYRIENLPGIDVQKTYKVVRLGALSNFQAEQLYSNGHHYSKGGDEHMDSELSPVWGPGDIFNYLGSKIKLQGYMNNDFAEDMAVARKLVGDIEPWPSQESVFIHEDMIILYLQE